MKHIRKILATLLSVLMLVSLVTMSATSTVTAAEKETIIIAGAEFRERNCHVRIEYVRRIEVQVVVDVCAAHRGVALGAEPVAEANGDSV